MPIDRVFSPIDVGVEADCLFLAFDVYVVAVNDAFQLVVLLVTHLLDVLWQLIQRQLLACHNLKRVAHGVTRTDVAIEVKHPQAFCRHIKQCVARDDQVQQRLVKHDTVVACFDFAQNKALNLA